MTAEPTSATIGGIFPRLAALVVDILAVVGAGMLLGHLLGPELSPLGGAARLIGYAALVAYFGFFDHFTATPGKQLMRLEVRRADGSHVPLGLTLLRSAVLFLPFLCSGANPGLAKWNAAMTTTEVAIVYTLGGALPLVWLLGGRSRQSVHDLVCQTYVVRARGSGPVAVRPARRWQSGLMLGWTAIILGTMARLQIDKFTRWPDQAKLQVADQKILSLPDVKGSGYTLMSNIPNGQPSRQLLPATSATVPQLPKTLVVSVDLRRKITRPAVLERQVVRTLVANYPLASQQSRIEVILAYGYDIGIARSYQALGAKAETADAWLGKAEPPSHPAIHNALASLSLAPQRALGIGQRSDHGLQ